MNVHDFTVAMPGGQQQILSDYAGKVLLVVNTASKCGFTGQYKGLEALHRKYADKGLVVMAFPCNQFGAQEPGDAAEIQNFCTLNYDVSFPLAKKIDVNGDATDPLWEHLKNQQAGLLGSRAIKWNFTKFLVDKDGKVAGRYAPTVTPESLEHDIERLLG
jgi:glutathione peroxidase